MTKSMMPYACEMVARAVAAGLSTTLWVRVLKQGHHDLLGYAIVVTVIAVLLLAAYIVRRVREEDES